MENIFFFYSPRLCPIFQVSNVEGTNLHLLTMFLNLLYTPRALQDDKEPPHFQIDDTYQVPVSSLLCTLSNARYLNFNFCL